LQLGEPASQLQDLPIIDLTSELKDWADTAALIANLDIVMTCCTAVAHLAAAMGKPTWILLHDGACWRWLEDRNDSPWYPTVRLFRQKTRGDWDGVMDDVVQVLKELEENTKA
jgi:ADP-heptose:LPS heptosyltransferase